MKQLSFKRILFTFSGASSFLNKPKIDTVVMKGKKGSYSIDFISA